MAAPFDNHANLASSFVVTAPGLAGTSLTVVAGEGALFPLPPYNCTVCPANTFPTQSNAEIVRVTAKVGDTFTILRAQEGTTAKDIQASFYFGNSITAKVITDIETLNSPTWGNIGGDIADQDDLNDLLATLAQAGLTTGLVSDTDTVLLSAPNNTTLRIAPMQAGVFSLLLAPGLPVASAIKSFPQTDFPLSGLGLVADGVYTRWVGYNSAGTVVTSTATFANDPSVINVGFIAVKRVAGVVTFIDDGGPRSFATLPEMAAFSDLERTYLKFASNVVVKWVGANRNLSRSAGVIQGTSVNWTGIGDKNSLAQAASSPASFIQINPATAAGTALPAAVTLLTCTNYWNGAASVPLAQNNDASVKRVLLGVKGGLFIQEGEAQYDNIDDATAAVPIAPFSTFFAQDTFIEIGRIVAVKNASDLSNPDQARFYITGAGAGGSAGGSPSAVTSVNGTPNEITAAPVVGAVVVSLPAALTFTGKTVTGGTFNSPTLVTPALGTPTSGVLTNCTGYNAGNLAGATLAANVVNASLNNITPAGGTLTVAGNINGNNANLTGNLFIDATAVAPGNLPIQIIHGAANYSIYVKQMLTPSPGNSAAIGVGGTGPTDMLANDRMGALAFFGRGTSGGLSFERVSTAIISYATQDWTAGAYGSRLEFGVTPTGSAARAVVATLSGVGLAITGDLSTTGRITAGQSGGVSFIGGIGGTGTTRSLLILDGGSANGGGTLIGFRANGADTGYVGMTSVLDGGPVANVLLRSNVAGSSVRIQPAGVDVGVFAATGFSVAGTITATGNFFTGGAYDQSTSQQLVANFLSSAADPYLRVSNGTIQVFLQSVGPVGVGATGTITNHPFVIRVNNTEAARFATTGLSVPGTITSSNYIESSFGGIRSVVSNDGGAGLFGTATNHPVRIYVNNAFVAEFNTTGLGVNGNIVANGSSNVQTSGVGGFMATTFAVNARNPIYRFGNALDYGISFFQGTSATDGTNGIGFHFGVPTAAGSVMEICGNTSQIFVRGNFFVTGTVAATTTGANASLVGIFGAGGFGSVLRNSTDTSGAIFELFQRADNTGIGSIQRVGTTNAVAYNTTSDGRLKENIRDFTGDDSGPILDGLRPRWFDWKNATDDGSKNAVGFVAQEEAEVDPVLARIGAVTVGDDGDGRDKQATVQWMRSDSALVPILVAELKALRARVAALEAVVNP